MPGTCQPQSVPTPMAARTPHVFSSPIGSHEPSRGTISATLLCPVLTGRSTSAAATLCITLRPRAAVPAASSLIGGRPCCPPRSPS